jgi:carboxypeptidase family protein
MKMKLLLSGFAISASLFANANNGNGEDNTRKSDMMGCVFHNETKKPLKDVCITAYIASKKEQVITTNENGDYSFEDLKPGVYKFVFQKDGYKKVIKDRVFIKTDDGFQMNIEMFETEDFNFMPGAFSFPMPQ